MAEVNLALCFVRGDDPPPTPLRPPGCWRVVRRKAGAVVAEVNLALCFVRGDDPPRTPRLLAGCSAEGGGRRG